MRRRPHEGRWDRRVAFAVAATVAATFAGTTGAARAADAPQCPTSAAAAYSLQLKALTGPAGSDLTISVSASPGCALPGAFKSIQLKTFRANGSLMRTRNHIGVDAPGGVAKDIPLGSMPRRSRVVADVTFETGTPAQTYVLHGAVKTLLRPDLVVEEISPQQTLAGKPVAVTAVIAEANGDVGATATVSMSAVPGAAEHVVVPPGGRITVRFAELTFPTAVPIQLTVKVDGAVPTETDEGNNVLSGTLDVTEHQLSTPRFVLFPSLVGYGAQFGMHLYTAITPWPTTVRNGDVEEKVRALEPQLVRIFYNDNWDGNANGKFPDWKQNYESFVKVVQFAQDAGATIEISFQNLGNAMLAPSPAMAKFADVLEELVRTDRLTNVRWVEVGNEPNSPTGAVTLQQYNAIARALHDELISRGLHDRIQIMGGGLIESGGARHHYTWMKWIAANMGDVFDAYAQHIYWWYDTPSRLEYRLRDVQHLANEVLPPSQRKPMYMMEYGVRGSNTCGTKPPFANLYYEDESCTEIWRTNIAAFQQLWFNIDAAQLGVAGTSKWDAYWSMYDKSSVTNQLYWMVGPPSEGSPLTPTYYAMSLLFHVTAPGWEILRVDPWEPEDWTVPVYGGAGLSTSGDRLEQELVGYAGPNGEVTIVGLDTHGQNLNTAPAASPSQYSIGGLPPDTRFRLAVWNAAGDGTNSIAGTVTTNSAGVARFEVPLQAAFALTTVPVS
jgi:hypothetical protein